MGPKIQITNMVKFEYQTFNLLDLSHVNQGPECRIKDTRQQSAQLSTTPITYRQQWCKRKRFTPLIYSTYPMPIMDQNAE